MTDEGIPSVADLPKTSPEIAANYSRSAVQEGDLVMSIGPSFGKVAMARAEHTGANLTQGTARIAIVEQHLARYFFWLLRSSDVHQYWTSIATGATFPALNLEPLGNTVVPIPSYKEQCQIAAYLDHTTALIDQLIAKNEQLITLLDDQRKAIINEAVTKGLDPKVPMKDSGIRWLGEVPEDWKIVPMKRLASIKYGLGQPPKSKEGGLPILRATNVERGRINLKNLITVDPEDIPYERDPVLRENDILVVRSGAYTADSAIVPAEFDGAIAGYDMVMRAHAINPKLLAYALLSTYLLENQLFLERSRAAQPHLNAEELGSALVLVPPIEKQDAIVAHIAHALSSIDGIKEKLRAQSGLLSNYRLSLISEAVTGKIDLREWEPAQQQAIRS